MHRALLTRREFLHGVAATGTTLLATSALAACGAGLPGRSGPTKITFWWVQQFTGITGKEDPKTVKPTDFADWMIGEFNKKYPDITVQREVLAFNDLRPKLGTAAASGTGGPDIFYEAASNLRKYATLGVLQPVDSYLDKNDTSDFIPLFIQQMTVKGKKYYWPLWTAGTSLVANRKIFKDLGAEKLLPQNDDRTWTFEQFLDAATAVTKDGRFAWGLGLADKPGDYHIHAFPWGMGGHLFSEDGAKYTFDSPEAAAGIQILADMELKSKTLVPGTAGQTWADLTQLFLQGKTAFLAGALNTKASILAAMKSGNIPNDAIDLYPIAYPSKPPIAPQHYSESGGVAVWHGKDNNVINAAMTFGKFASSTEMVKAMCTAAQFPPSRVSAGDVFNGEPYGEYVSKAASKWGNSDVLQLGYYDLRQVVLPMYQSIMAGQKSVKDALAESTKPAQDIIDKLRSGK
jgi:ABC-type glycerol-3-phosphate transport system substrate-binding protein